MNRRQKIIVSVTGIFLVLLILVGLTYAYFLTRIIGNTNNKSISVTTANLVLTYGDGNGVLEVGEKIRPGNSIKFKTSTGATVNEKTFTVTNEGDATDYVVIVDNVTITKDGTSTTFVSNDFIYTLTCTSSDDNKCDGTTDSIFPLKNQSILVGNRIAENVTHTYTLTMEYKETGKNQSDDMGKTFTAKIDIDDIRRLENPYKDNTSSLAYNIINNSVNKLSGTKLVASPPTKVAEEISSINWDEAEEEYIFYDDTYVISYAPTEEALYNCYDGIYDEETDEYLGEDCSEVKEYSGCTEDVVGKYVWDDDYWGPIKVDNCKDNKILELAHKDEKVLSIANDDYGISYYYRGNVRDNYVNFAGMCWKIVRINGNGNVKLILSDKNTTCDSTSYNGNWQIGYGNYGNVTIGQKYLKNYLEPTTNADESMVKAFYDYQNTLNTKISTTYQNKGLNDYLVSGDWCMNDAAYLRSGESPNYDFTFIRNNAFAYEYSETIHYDSYVRLSGHNRNGYIPTLKCNGNKLNKFKNVVVNETQITNESDMYVGTLTAFEIVYAGAIVKQGAGSSNDIAAFNKFFYLCPNNEYCSMFWSLSRFASSNYQGGYDTIYYFHYYGYVETSNYSWGTPSFRPTVNLKSGIEISGGNGTQSNPYVVE